MLTKNHENYEVRTQFYQVAKMQVNKTTNMSTYF